MLKISEVAEIFGVSTSTLKVWEKTKGITASHRVGNDRRYTESDMKKIAHSMGKEWDGLEMLSKGELIELVREMISKECKEYEAERLEVWQGD